MRKTRVRAYVVRLFRLRASPRRENVFPAARPAPLVAAPHGRITHRRRRPDAHRVARDTPPARASRRSVRRHGNVREIKCIYLYVQYICDVHRAHARITVNLTTRHLRRERAFLSCRRAGGGGHDGIYVKTQRI